MSKVDVKNGILDALASGMTLRDVLAAAAVAGLLANTDNGNCDSPWLAGVAYEQADDMLLARNTTAAGNERQKQLAVIGELAVRDFVGAETEEFATQELNDAIRAFVRDAKAADTLPAPAPEDVGLAVSVPEAPSVGRMVGPERGTQDADELTPAVKP